jgi:hypothetical protein
MRQRGPLGLAARKRAYFAMMGVCLVLIVLAWTLIWRYSILASVVMSAVALCIPPLAAIVANAGPANRQLGVTSRIASCATGRAKMSAQMPKLIIL